MTMDTSIRAGWHDQVIQVSPSFLLLKQVFHAILLTHIISDYYEVYHQKTAVKLLRGKLNTPGKGTTWSLEIAISYKDIMAHIDENPAPPAIGQMWRINFSRVENKGDTNWTWYVLSNCGGPH